ncbi:MAG: hypothetical protein K6C34_01630 [Alphaproteobacteria bacterium]|nr:hypothetical protein [Alphaproteobacteria bacterium]
MRKVLSFVVALNAFTAFADDEGLEPTIYADISEAAQVDAVTFDGFRGFIGMVFQTMNYQACTAKTSENTENKMNIFSLSVGVEYAKAFRKGFLIGVDISADINKKKKKDGNWTDLNRAYDTDTVGTYGNAALKKGKLESEALTPNMSVKLGYLMPRYNSILFLKAGLSKLGGTYVYSYSGADVSKVDVSKFIPVIGLGGEYKINSKLGAGLEANMSLGKTATKDLGGVSHKIKLSRKDIRLMGTYRISAGR